MKRVQKLKFQRKIRRKKHIRKTIFGTEERPRMSIFRSLNNIYVQLVNDDASETVCATSTLDKDVKEQSNGDMKKTELCKLVGNDIAKKALEKGIKEVAFDRNGFIYHGRVKALADAARKGGLKF